jgi:lysophospholipase L1-like esterase
MTVAARCYARFKLAQTASGIVVSHASAGWSKGTPRVLAIGDSRVARWIPGEGGPLRLATSGVGGETSGQLLARWQTTALPPPSTTVLILTGVNDLVAANLNSHRSARIERELIANVGALAAQLRRQGMIPMIGTVAQAAEIDWRRRIFGWSDELRALIERSNTSLRALAQTRGYAWFDTNAALAMGDDQRIPARFALDTLHWNETAYRALERQLASQLAASETQPT